MRIFQCHLLSVSAGLPEANEAPLKPMAPLNSMGHGVIVPPSRGSVRL